MFPTNNNSNRLTNPVGTFLPGTNQPTNPFSNPSAAASGPLGGAYGGNNLPPVPQIGAQVGTQQAIQQNNTGFSSFGNWLKGLFTTPSTPMLQGQQRFQNNVGQNQTLPNYRNPLTNKFTPMPVNNKPTGAFANTPTPSSTTSSSAANPLVGTDIGANPDKVDQTTIQQMFSGLTSDQISQNMQSMGYSYVPPSGSNDYQGFWMKTGQGQNQSVNGGNPSMVSSNGQYFDPGQLQRGETVRDQWGRIIRGGTPTTKDLSASTPAGTGQYSVTYAQNLNQKLEAKGAYKWQSKLSRDANGNWVRSYYKVLRGPYTRNGRRRIAERNANAANTQKPTDTSAETNQLVTLRANYG